MVQIENENWYVEGPRDYSEIANKLYDSEVPSTLVDFFEKNEQSLHPDMLKKWKENGSKTRGKWIEVFGNDIYSEEMFTAWNYARYVEKMAKTARSIYSIPLYVNAAMNSRNRKPGISFRRSIGTSYRYLALCRSIHRFSVSRLVRLEFSGIGFPIQTY